PQPVRRPERRALQRVSDFLVIERVEQIVDGDGDRMLSREAVCRARVNDGEVVVIDDREAWSVEVVVLSALDVASRHARAESTEVEVHAGSHGVKCDIYNL